MKPMERLTIPDVRIDKNTIRRSIIDAEKVKERAMEIYWRLKEIEDVIANADSEEYDLNVLRKLLEKSLRAIEPLTPAQVKDMDYDKVWIDYGDDGEWGIIVDGLLYSISTLEGAGFVDMLQDAVRGEDVERPSGDYKLYLQKPQSEEGAT